MPLFHTRHFYKHNSSIVGHQCQDGNVQQSNRDVVITCEEHHGQSSSAWLVCNWSCKINKDHIARAIILSSSQTNNRPQLLHSPEPGDPRRRTKTWSHPGSWHIPCPVLNLNQRRLAKSDLEEIKKKNLQHVFSSKPGGKILLFKRKRTYV